MKYPLFHERSAANLDLQEPLVREVREPGRDKRRDAPCRHRPGEPRPDRRRSRRRPHQAACGARRRGKSGGYRTLVLFRHAERAIFVFGFAKNDRANLNAAELRTYKQAAKIVLELSPSQIETEVEAGRLIEVNPHAQNL